MENITEDVFDKEGVGKDVNGSTAKVFSPTKELEDHLQPHLRVNIQYNKN